MNWRSRTIALSSWIVAAACGGAPAQAPLDAGALRGGGLTTVDPATIVEPKDGTRLKVQWLSLEGGGRVAAGLLDTAMGVLCSIVERPDHSFVCAPDVTRSAAVAGTTLPQMVLFADDQCAQPVRFMSNPTCTPAWWWLATSSEGCHQTAAWWTSGGVLPEVKKLYARTAAGACQATSLDPSAGEVHRLVPLGEHTSVVGRLQKVRDGNPELHVIAMADGAWWDPRWIDSASGNACKEGVAADGKGRCLPVLDRAYEGFADAACTQPMVVTFGTTACPNGENLSRWLDMPETSSCGLTHRIFERGASVEAYIKSVSTCRAAPVSSPAFSVGTEIPASTFPLLASKSVMPGTGRLRAEVTTTGAAGFVTGVVDTLTGTPCLITPAADGRVRCLPARVGTLVGIGGSYFADAACQTGLTWLPSSCELPFTTEAADVASCTVPRRVFQSIPYRGDVYLRTATACMPVTDVRGVTFQRGAEVPADQLPPFAP